MIETYIGRVILCNLVIAMDEIWKDIQGYEGKYQVSNRGNVLSLNYRRERRPKILKPKETRGYYQVGLRKNGRRTFIGIHQLVAKHFAPGYKYGLQVNHINLNKHDNRASNLEWVTPKENTLHAIANGRFFESKRKLKMANEQRKKKVMAKKGGNAKAFSSIHEASRKLGIDRKQIMDSLNGKHPIAKGYSFYYV